MKAHIPILKRFEEWGTAFRSKFQGDLFFRTTLYVIGVQAGLVVVSIAAFSLVLHYSNQQVVRAVIIHLAASASTTAAVFSPVLPASIDAIQNQSVQLVFVGMVVVSLFFG